MNEQGYKALLMEKSYDDFRSYKNDFAEIVLIARKGDFLSIVVLPKGEYSHLSGVYVKTWNYQEGFEDQVIVNNYETFEGATSTMDGMRIEM